MIARRWVLFLGFAVWSPCVFADEPTFAQRAEAKRIARDIERASTLIAENQVDQAASIWMRAHERTEAYLQSADAQQSQFLASEVDRLTQVRMAIEGRGVSLPNLPGNAAELTPQPSPPASSGPSFAKQVAPILVEKCGRCHIDARRGRFSMETIAALTSAADRIVSGKPAESHLYLMVESGEMPKGKTKLASGEIQTLRDWIESGADFGDANRDLPLRLVAGFSVEDAPANTPEAATPAASDVISFAEHIAPMLIDRCASCHMNAQRLRGGLSLATFEGLTRGGDSGEIVQPSRGEESLLVKKLRGTGGGQQMPAGDNPLRAEQIQMISQWIDQGAKFDGGSSSANLRDVVARLATTKATHEELSSQRQQRALANWELVMDGVDPLVHASENVIVVAMNDTQQPEQFAEIAESIVNRVATQVRLPDKTPLVKGKIAAYLFATRYDYAEFGKMIEQRDIPREWTNHWGNDQVDAFIAFQIPARDYDTMRPWIARNIAAAYAKGLASDVPDWFANGWAYSIAAKIYAGDEIVRTWNQKATELTKRMTNRDDFIANRIPPDDAGLVAFHFIEYLKQNGGNRFQKMIGQLRDGSSFDRAFALSFEATPAEILAK